MMIPPRCRWAILRVIGRRVTKAELRRALRLRRAGILSGIAENSRRLRRGSFDAAKFTAITAGALDEGA